MQFLFDILNLSTGSVVWGVLMALAMMALFVFIVRGWWKDAMFTAPTYILGALLALVLMFHCTLFVGALKIINMTDTYQPVVEGFVDKYFTSNEEVTVEKANEVLADFIDEYPLVQHYIGGGEFYGMRAAELATSIMDELRSYMRKYMLRRALWSLGFTIVLGGLAIYTMRRPGHGMSRTSGRERPSGSRTDRERLGNRSRDIRVSRHGRRR